MPDAAWFWNLHGNRNVSYVPDGEEEYNTLREYVAVEEPKENADGETPEKNQKETVTVDFEALKKINPEIIAWIRIPDTKIDYPVVQGTDNEYYLKRTFKKTEHVAGSIFLDKDNSSDFSNRKSILYRPQYERWQYVPGAAQVRK